MRKFRDVGTQCYRHALARRLQLLEEATSNLGRLSHSHVAVPKQQRQLSILSECLAIILNKPSQFYITTSYWLYFIANVVIIYQY